ncbi:uncharacterized protein BT62DRAFT_374766 [Guyanagaster necrorhizus]|uniref:Uncharacterized protein n=1 Tax=Guyanagaster necrorhizus TaxID=856835 RepID=A0A9P8AP37_9AGAR|nr:uncharacterized protein BT62DRAFT_374766 [Guyanagaster necrorhizus MCA 3950]KAG7442549.1 hypothetical protein BT62DRAFT_374766 [Guyanagaster necrorhizus MCA 3950]
MAAMCPLSSAVSSLGSSALQSHTQSLPYAFQAGRLYISAGIIIQQVMQTAHTTCSLRTHLCRSLPMWTLADCRTSAGASRVQASLPLAHTLCASAPPKATHHMNHAGFYTLSFSHDPF